MQVFFENPAFFVKFKRKNRLIKNPLGEPVAKSIILIIVVAASAALLAGLAAYLNKAEYLSVGELNAVEHILEVAVGC